jgi:hypothetical protein
LVSVSVSDLASTFGSLYTPLFLASCYRQEKKRIKVLNIKNKKQEQKLAFQTLAILIVLPEKKKIRRIRKIKKIEVLDCFFIVILEI